MCKFEHFSLNSVLRKAGEFIGRTIFQIFMKRQIRMRAIQAVTTRLLNLMMELYFFLVSLVSRESSGLLWLYSCHTIAYGTGVCQRMNKINHKLVHADKR